MVTTNARKRLLVLAVTGGIALGGGALAVSTLAGGSAGASTQRGLRPAMPAGVSIKCRHVTGVIQLTPGIGATATSGTINWGLVATGTTCSHNANNLFPGPIVSATAFGTGTITGGTCAAATNVANWGAAQLTVSYASLPSTGNTIFSSIPSGTFQPQTTLDSGGIVLDRNNAGTTPVFNDIGGKWTPASAAALNTACSGTAPSVLMLSFNTSPPGTNYYPAFAVRT